MIPILNGQQPDFLAAILGDRDPLRVRANMPGSPLPPLVVHVQIDHDSRRASFVVDGAALFRHLASGDRVLVSAVSSELEKIMRSASTADVGPHMQYRIGETASLERGHAIARTLRAHGFPAVVEFHETPKASAPAPSTREIAAWGRS